jgi:uncharacterized protein YjbJ (UPF0337 family)
MRRGEKAHNGKLPALSRQEVLISMNWDQIEGKWKQMKGEIRQKWAKLTDDDFDYIGGSKDRFVGRLQERYGHSKEQAERDLEAWQRGLGEPQYR